METKKVAKEYMQKDILRTIFQMRKRQEDDKQIKRIIVLDYDLTEYHWKTNIKKLQEEGFLKTDSDAKIPALTESGMEYARQLQRAAEGWNQFLQMSGPMKRQQTGTADSWRVRYPIRTKSTIYGNLSMTVEEVPFRKV